VNEKLLSDQKLRYIKNYLKLGSILDVGAGCGHYSWWIAKNYPQAQVIALDRINIENPIGFKYQKTNLEEKLSAEKNQFDTILAFDVIEHITNHNSLLKELFRVCKNGGILIGSVPHDDDGFLPNYNLTFYHRSDLTHKRYYLVDSLKKDLQRVGFNILKIEALGGVPPNVITEFFTPILKPVVKKFVGLCRRIKLVNSPLKSDLFFVAKRQ